MGANDSPVWVELGFRCRADHTEWQRWREGVARGVADPDEWIYFEGERSWYRSAEFVHVGQIAALANALSAQPPKAKPVQAPQPAPEFLAPAEFAARLGVDRKTIDRRVPDMAEGVHYLRVGRRVVIHVANATEFLAGRGPRAAVARVDLLAQFSAKARKRA